MNIRSASRMAESISVEKNRFLPRHFFTTSSSPGCWDKRKKLKTVTPTDAKASRCLGGECSYLKDRQFLRIPSIYSRLAKIDHGHFNLGAF